ncbi:MAG: twin-arginine translocation signal domain-containing protein [Planctomycetota bacterium]|nr:twin-arginine translocation signal domain-containing protein [Planctomycetota bacterium]
MTNSKTLFPHRESRRNFLKYSGAAIASASMTVSSSAMAESKVKPVTIGSGHWTYTLDENWGRLPAGMSYGFGCAVAVDSKDRIFVTSRSESPCIAIFSRSGELLETWSNDFAEKVNFTTGQVKATAHGLYVSKEGNDEFLYFTENVNKEKGEGARVYKTDMHGKVLYELGKNVAATSNSQPFDFTNPTDVAVAPNGDIYIVDGYGSQRVSRFDKNFTHIKTIGGPGKEHGQFKTCHGVWIRTQAKEPEVYIADRSNGRIEIYSLDLEYRRTISDLRAPCCFYEHDGYLFIPELSARVTVLDRDDKVVAHLGDGKGIKKEEIDLHPEVFATPHALTLDSAGDLYVIEWLPNGRPRKFKHTPA